MDKMTFRGVLVACSLLAGVAQAQNKVDEAKAHVKSGAELYDENNFRGALVEFQRAYELAPSYKIMFNIAQVQMELADYAGALTAYSRYLSEGGPDVPANRRSEVVIEIERLKGRVGSIAVQTVAGAEVLHYRGRSAARNPATERLYRQSQLAYYEKHLPRWSGLLRAYLKLTGKPSAD